MPTPVWTASVSIDSTVIVGTAPPTQPAVVASRLLTARDSTISGAVHGNAFALVSQLNSHNYGLAGTFEWLSIYLVTQKPFPSDPYTWQVIIDPGTGLPLQLQEADGFNGAAYLGGGTLSITKDYDNGRYLFSTPLGSLTLPFAWLALQPFGQPVWTPDNGPLVADGMGHGFTLVDDTIFNSETSKWYDFYTRKDGVIVAGWPLSAAVPGFWTPWTKTVFTGFPMVDNDGQETSRYRTAFTYTPPDFGHEASTTETRFATMGATSFFGLDLATEPNHHMQIGAWVPAMTALKVRRSHDDGHTWTETTAVTGTNTLADVTIQEFGGAFYVLYWDTTVNQVHQTVSRDLGQTWSDTVISITGSNPRLAISPEGSFFYFVIDGSGSIVLQRSFDLGATLFDATPLVVATSVPMQDFGVGIAADRSVLVAYADGSNAWVTRISKDYGLTWANA